MQSSCAPCWRSACDIAKPRRIPAQPRETLAWTRVQMQVNDQLIAPLRQLGHVVRRNVLQFFGWQDSRSHVAAPRITVHCIPLLDAKTQVTHRAISEATTTARGHHRERLRADSGCISLNRVHWNVQLMSAHEETVSSAVDDTPQHIQHVAPKDDIHPWRCFAHVHHERVDWRSPLQA